MNLVAFMHGSIIKIEYDRCSQHICWFGTTSRKSTQSIRRCGRREGCLHHSSSKSLSSQKLIDFTVLMWLNVGLTQPQQPLLVLCCVLPGAARLLAYSMIQISPNQVTTSNKVWWKGWLGLTLKSDVKMIKCPTKMVREEKWMVCNV